MESENSAKYNGIETVSGDLYDGKPVRQNILALGQKITDRLGRKLNEHDPEYWGLNEFVTDEMAEIALQMDVRKPITLPKLAKKTGKDEKYLEDVLFKMALAGLIEYNWENPKREKQYVLPMFVPGSAEFSNMNEKQLEEHPKIGRFFERMSFEPLEKITPMVPQGGAGIGMHVIPVEKAIETENHSVSVEHISHWLSKYEGKYAASPCSCRMSRKTYDEGCGDDPRDWCIGVGDMADYIVETNRGHYINKDEVLALLKHAEDNGFVHQITNIDGENKIFAICNCNVNVCYALRTSLLFNTPNLSRSAYVARVTPEKCVACGKCVEVCPAGAAKLGQKLSTKNGPIKYPKHELPDAVKWGPEKWDMNYRNNNRINCYETGTAPCKTACPAHVSVQGYLRMASEGRYTEALALIKKDNPFPAVCGRVCNKRCEAACTRGTLDQAVSVDEVKKFIAQKDLDSKTRYIPQKIIPSNRGEFSQKIAIIGAGPAGLSCAYYLAEKGYRPTVFEKNAQAGGMLVYGIPSFKLEKDVVQAEIDILKEMGVEIKCGVEVGKDVSLQDLRNQGYKAFYIAIGCQGSRKANIPGEDAKNVMSAVDFLKEVADNHDYKVSGKTVVVGVGNVAIDVSRTALRCGSSKVLQFCLEQRNEMPATVEEIEEAEEEGIEISCGWGPKEILTKNGKVCGIVFKKCTSVKDADGRFNPKYDENDTITLDCDNVFLSIGQAISWGGLLENSKVEFWHGNYPLADKTTYQTGESDIFVGGDVYTGPKFAIDAIAAGKLASVSLHRFVQPRTSLTIGRDKREFIELDKDNLAEIQGYDNTPRQVPGKCKNQQNAFSETNSVFTEDQIKKETARCLSCGATIVDENHCVGCGLCTTRCNFDAIHLFRENPGCSKMVKSEDKLKSILPYMLKREIKIKFNKKKD